MPEYETNSNKSDEPTGTKQYVCEDCGSGVSGRVTTDAVGNPTPSYRCPIHGHRVRSELVRQQGGA